MRINRTLWSGTPSFIRVRSITVLRVQHWYALTYITTERLLRVLMLAWEYPPRIVGGIARHTAELARALAAQGVEVHVVTCEHPGAPAEEVATGVSIHRVAPYEPQDNFIHWVHQLNAAMRTKAQALITNWRSMPAQPTLLHAHDWVTRFCATDLKHEFHLPLVVTIHATEHGRNHGIRTEMQHYIHAMERQLSHECWRLIVCSWFMKGEVEAALDAPWDKVDVIPNGIDMSKFHFRFTPKQAAQFRAQYASPDEKLLLFVGRLVHEKGVQVLLDALSLLRWWGDNVKLVVAGGGERRHLEQQAAALGVTDHVYFTGFVSDTQLVRLYKVADVAAYPSLYEPFGIVALEAMAAGVPVVVSNAGGLVEVVEHNITGTVTQAGDSTGLAAAISALLHNTEHAQRLVQNGLDAATGRFAWREISRETVHVYNRIWGEYLLSDWYTAGTDS